MPTVRAFNTQIVDENHAILTVATSDGNTLVIDVVRVLSPTVVTISAYQNGILFGERVLSNPPAATLEDEIAAAVEDLVLGAFQLRTHLMSVTPLRLLVGVFDAGSDIPPDWFAPG